MQTIKRTTLSVAGIAAAAMLSLTACGGAASTAPASSAPAATPMASSMAPSPSTSSAAAMDPAANLVGAGSSRLRRPGPQRRRLRLRNGP